MSLLLALCGDKREIFVKKVPLNSSVQEDVVKAFLEQEEAFRAGDEIPFDENWLNEGDEVAVAPIPEDVSVFGEIQRSTDTSLAPIDVNNLEEIRGLAIKPDDGRENRILVQSFATGQFLSNPRWVSLLLEKGTYTRLEASAFRLGDKLVCIVEDGFVKFRSLHNLGRVIDTSAIFSVATDSDVRSFASEYSNLFEFADVDKFVAGMSRNARKYMMSLAKSKVLQNHTAQTLKEAAADTNLKIGVQDDKIVMPGKRGDITELMRFLNDGRYVGPISGDAFVTNSRRRAT